MLQPVPEPNLHIIKTYRRDNSLFMEQEKGIIRITPQADNIIRVSYTEEKQFSETRSREINDLSGDCNWYFEECEDEIYIYTGLLRVGVTKETGSVRYENLNGELILREKEYKSKTVEGFDAYCTVNGNGAKVEEVRTPDGIKRKIHDAERVFNKRLYRTGLSLIPEEDELLFGLGQPEDGVWNLRGTVRYIHQANLKIAIPMIISNKGYGVLLSSHSPMIYEDTKYGSYIYSEADDYLDYYFIGGNMPEIIRVYRKLTGKASMLPKWAFGYMQSQERYESAEEIEKTVCRFRQTGFGLDTIILDWMSWPDGMWGQKTFDNIRFPNPKGMIDRLHENNVHFMISIWPNMTKECDNYKEFSEAGLLFPNSDIYNAYSEEGRRLYWNQAEKGLFKYGIDGWWCDSSEPVTPEWEYVNKPPAAKMYWDFVNAADKLMPVDEADAYGYYHARTMYEGQRSVTEEKRVVNLTRSGYTGSQKYGTILWSGDIYASWDTLKKQITAGLQFVSCGHPYWTLDIGAFFVKKGNQWYWNGDYEDGADDMGYRELYVRWFQYGAFLPIFRSHGTDTRREPWNFGKEGEPFYDALLSANRLRYRLMPYIYSLAGNAWRNDELIMRPLIYDFQDDIRAGEIYSQYMFGPAFMVCPVTEPVYYESGSRKIENADLHKTVYLPGKSSDIWYDWYTNRRYNGGQEITVEISLEHIPVFVRSGSIVPTMEAAVSTADTDGKDITLLIYTGADGTFEMYEDAGDGYGYENGEYCVTKVYYNDECQSVRWETDGNTKYRKGAISYKIL